MSLLLRGFLAVGAVATAVSALEGCSVTSQGEPLPDGGDVDADMGEGGVGGPDGMMDDPDAMIDGGVDGMIDDLDAMVDGGPDGMVDDPDGGPDSSIVMVGTGTGPEILRPDLMGVPLAPTRAFLRWTSDAEAFTYQICYTTGASSEINGEDECPNKSSTTKTDAVIDNLDNDATYRWKVRFFRDDGTFSLFSAVSTFTTDDSLTAWWKFDGDLGLGDTVVTDSSGNGLDGVLVTNDANNTESGPDTLGRAMILDGLNDYTDLTAVVGDIAFDGDGKHSLEMRFRVDATAPDQTLFFMSDTTGLAPMLRHSIIPFSSDYLWQTRMDDNRWITPTGDANIAPIVEGEFIHGVFIYYEITTQGWGRQFLDGIPDGPSILRPPSGTLLGGDFDVAAIGATTYTGSPSNLFNGAIDEVAVYDRALDEAVIVNNYCAFESLLDNTLPSVCTD